MRKGKERKAKGRNKNKGKKFVGEREGNGKRRPNVQKEKKMDAVRLDFLFSFRERDFSLKSRLIRSSDSFGPRRKAVLRGEGNTWTPVLRSFDKIREVRVLSYLFYPLFKCFVNACVGLRP